ncbi:ABC transporter substrate-binding protein [Rhodococcoides yunnanense]|uniref:ABC transporter substrate-binding protein n=1 Tax=Rhodococcoides yunnanense TaxID=278209 RepID=UPI0009349611|nr:ABC transporter substrate-binding protein [Rhodococcus yunnanensis]
MKFPSRRSKTAVFAAATVMSIVLAGCSGAASTTDTATAATGDPVRGGTLVVGEDTQPVSGFDPMLAQALDAKRIVSQFYEGLLSINSSFDEVQPGLASEWTQLSETKYSFTLRDGVTFHDGEAVKPSDVVFSLNRIADPNQSSPYKRLYDLKSVTAVDDSTIEIETNEPQASLLTLLAQPWSGGIVSEAWFTSRTPDEIKTSENGTGPFTLSEFREGALIKTVRFDNYWEGDKPYLDGIDYRLIPAEATRVQAIGSGSVDMIEVRASTNADSLEGRGVNIGPAYGIGTAWYALDTLDGPLADVEVRRALSMGIDREQMIDVATLGTGTFSYVIPPADPFGTEASDESPYYKYDPDAAREALAAAGAENLTLTMLVRSDNPKSVSTAELMKQQLSVIGVNLEIQTVPFNQVVNAITGGDWNADIVTLNSALNADPSQYLDLWFAEGAPGTKVNDPKLWSMMDEAARITTGTEDRRAKYEEIGEYVADNALLLVPYASPIVYDAWGERVHGFDADLAAARLFTKNVWIG